MRRTRAFGVAPIRCAAVAVLLLSAPAAAQDVTEPALKAVYIYNFAKFTDWPAGLTPAAAPFVMCVSGDGAVADALERAVHGRAIGSHSLIVLREAPADSQRVCHLLYVSGVSRDRAGQVVAGLRDLAVLTLSDVDGFTDVGGIAQFFFQHGRLRFTVRVESAKRARLEISSRLLTLATSK